MRNDSSTIATEEDESTVAWSVIPGPDDNKQSALGLILRNLYNKVGVKAKETTSHVCLTMTARQLEDEGKRAPVDIMIALDVSGSMSGSKLALCKTTLEQLIRMLSSEDRFGLITYDSNSQLEYAPKKMTSENKAMALQKIRELQTRGATNISSAIGLAFQELRSIENPNSVRTIFLLTDGHANQGISDSPGLVEFTRNCVNSAAMGHKAASSDRKATDDPAVPKEIDTAAIDEGPISMYTFGYGTDHNADMLADLAMAASGGYYYVENDSNVAGAFGDALGGVMSVVAQNATVSIKIHPHAEALGVKILKVHHKQATLRENGSYSVNVGDFYAEETRDVLVEVKMGTPSSADDDELIPHLVASLAYSDTVQKTLVQGEEHVALILRPKGAEISAEDAYVAAQLLRVSVAEGLERAQFMANRGDLASANCVMASARGTIRSAAAMVQSSPMVQQLDRDLEYVTEGMASARMYQVHGSKRVAYKTQTHTRQRCSETTEDDQASNAYTTTFKGRIMKKMNKKSDA